MNIYLNNQLIVLPDNINGIKTEVTVFVDSVYCRFSSECIKDLNKYFSGGCCIIHLKTKEEIFGVWKFAYSLWKALSKISEIVIYDPWVSLATSMAYTLLSLTSKLAEYHMRRFCRKFNNCINKVISETFTENDTNDLKEIFESFGRKWSGEAQVSLMLMRLIDNIISGRPDILLSFRGQLTGHLENIVYHKVNPIRSEKPKEASEETVKDSKEASR